MNFNNQGPPLNLDYLVEQIGDRKVIFDIVLKYQKHLNKQVQLLGEELDSCKYVEVHRIAHSIKGGAGNIGAEKLRESAWKLEIKAKQGDLVNCTPLYSALKDNFSLVDSYINDLVKGENLE